MRDSHKSLELLEMLKKLFPPNFIHKELYIKYKDRRLFFDFYIQGFELLFEIQGRQHAEFIKMFHKDIEGFLESKKRDNLKLEYVQQNKLALIIIHDNEELTEQILLNKILEAQNGRLNYKRPCR